MYAETRIRITYLGGKKMTIKALLPTQHKTSLWYYLVSWIRIRSEHFVLADLEFIPGPDLVPIRKNRMIKFHMDTAYKVLLIMIRIRNK
jgi:hypothetical protein